MIKIDNQDNMALNDMAGEETSLDTTPVAEPQTTEEVIEPTGAPESEVTETGGENRKGFQARVQELNQRAKAAEEKAKSLEDKLAELTRPVGLSESQQVPQYNPQEPLIKPGEEIDAAELSRRMSEREQRILQQADARAELRARQSEAISRINREAGEIVNKYPELNPDSDSFNKELSDTVTEATEAFVKANPYSASPAKFVSRLMNTLQGAASKEVGKATENVAKQVSSAALRPTSVKQPEKTASEKTIAELEAELGITNS